MIKLEVELDFFPYMDERGNIHIDIFRGREDVPCEKVVLHLADIVKSELEMHEIPGTGKYSKEGCEQFEMMGRRMAHQARRLLNASKRVYERDE